MQVHSVISNTISEEVLQNGHLSIRFMADGFSLLLEDKSYRAIILNRYRSESLLTLKTYIAECEDWLVRHTLLPDFKGETTILYDKAATALVPDSLFNQEDPELYLQPFRDLLPDETGMAVPLKNRNITIVFHMPGVIKTFSEKFTGKSRMLPLSSVLFSVADQINASDHQRGFMLLEMQGASMGILVIKDDQVVLSNQLSLKENAEIVYHTLNSITNLGIDRKKIPLYICGKIDDNACALLGKYVSEVRPLSYHILDIDKEAISEHVVLAEATQCE